MNVHQIFHEAWTFLVETDWIIQRPKLWATGDGSFIKAMCLLVHRIPCRLFGETSNHPGDSASYSPDLAPCNFCLFPKLKSPLKGKRFQTIHEFKENTTTQVMAIGRTVWAPRMPALKGTEVWLSCAQYFFYLVSSSINASILHITWLDTFCTALIHTWLSPQIHLIYGTTSSVSKETEMYNHYLFVYLLIYREKYFHLLSKKW